MGRLVNYIRGTVRVTITGAFPERVINLCAQERIDFWSVEWRDEHTVCFTLRHRGLAGAMTFAERVNCRLAVERRAGLPEFVGKFRHRYAFLAGLTVAMCAVGFLSRFVLTVEVAGNERVSDAAILQQLQRFGVRPGAYGPGLDRRQIEQEILLAMEDLSWMTINLYGTRIEVQVRERQAAPKRVDESGCYHIVAEADGIVTHVEPELGDAIVKKGDLVGKGEILISGTVTLEPPQYSELPNRYYDIHARGRVWARTWRETKAVIPVNVVCKTYTGREKRAWAINFFGKRMDFFGNSSILDGSYDKITSVRQIGLPGGIILPVWIVCETYNQYETDTLPVDLEAAAGLLEDRLYDQLVQLVGEDGQVLHTSYETCVTDGLLRVTAFGECLEEIGREEAAQRGVNSGDSPE